MPVRLWIVPMLALVACGERPPVHDAGVVAVDSGAPIPSPAPPVLTPCPAGWREHMADGTTACEPWPEAGRRTDCAPDEAHFPGEPGCIAVSVPCPLDGWPAALASDRPVVFVDDEAAVGGDGTTRLRAYRTIGGALASSPPDAIIAVATGRYDDANLVVTDARELRGACAAGTFLTTTAPGSVSVDLAGGGSALHDVTIDVPERLGVLVEANDVVITGVVIRGALGTGLAVLRGAATIRDLRIEGTRATSGTTDRGIHVEDATLTLSRASIETAHGTGLFAGRAGTSIDASDLVVTGMLPASDGTLGRAVEAAMGASIVLTRAVLEDNRDQAVSAQGAGTTVVLRDVVVRRNAAELASGQYGRCVDAEAGAHLTMERVALAECTEVAVFASGAGTELEASDLLITDTLSRPADGTRGRAIDASLGATLTLSRVRVLRSREMGLFATADARATASDLEILDTRSRPGDGSLGAGIWAQIGAHVELTRVRVARAQLAGIAAIDRGTVVLDDVRVEDVVATDCAASTCPDLAGGFALSSHFGGTLRAMRFDVGGAALCGLVVGADHPDGTPTSMDVSDGVVRDVPIGACVQVDGFDSSRLHSRVAFVEVAIPLEATSYSIPVAQ